MSDFSVYNYINKQDELEKWDKKCVSYAYLGYKRGGFEASLNTRKFPSFSEASPSWPRRSCGGRLSGGLAGLPFAWLLAWSLAWSLAWLLAWSLAWLLAWSLAW